MTEQLAEKLNTLSEYRAQVDAINLQKSEALKAAMPDEVRKAMEDIEAEFAGKAEHANAKIAELEAEIKKDGLLLEESVKGENLMFVFNKGRVSWDTKAIEGKMLGDPSFRDEMIPFRKVGNPYGSIRSI